MMWSPQTGRATAFEFPKRFERVLLACFGALASTILLKIAGVQLLEIIEILLVLFVSVRIIRFQFHIELPAVFFKLARHYVIFCVLVSFGALAALWRPVYVAEEGLYRLGLLSFSRLLEVLCDVFALILLAEVFRRNPSKCIFTMRVYFWVGSMSALAGIIGVLGHISLFETSRRASGFYNEGGPLGLFLVSNLVVGWLLSAFESRNRRNVIFVSMAINVIALGLSASKAAMSAIIFLIFLQILLSKSVRQRVAVGCIAIVAVPVILNFTVLSKGVENYVSASQAYVTLSNLRPTDYNVTAGRIAGLFLVPRMTAEHPWIGVGLGNYGLVRNAYEYRASSAWIYIRDDPGLGIIGLVCEVGIPLFLYLLVILFYPLAAVRRKTTWAPLLSLALIQPVVHIFGAQLNLTYPWIVSSFALGLTAAGIDSKPRRLFVATQDNLSILRTEP